MDQVSEIKQKINIVDVVGDYVSLKKAGKNYKGICPFHSEKTPSFMVSPELQIYKCFGCGEAGDVFSFVEKMEGIGFPQALEKLGAKVGVKVLKSFVDKNAAKKTKLFEINHLTMEFYAKLLSGHAVGKKALDYLKERRGFKAKTLQEFKLGYAPNSWDILFRFLKKQNYLEEEMLAAGVITKRVRDGGYVDKFRGRIIFPFVDISGKVVGFSGRTLFDKSPKYLNTSETEIFHKSSFLFGLNFAKVAVKKEGAVFVEGPTDVISAHQAGLQNVIASSGTALTLGQLQLVARYTSDVTFCFDSDPAGILAIQRAVELAEKAKLNAKVVLVPDEYKDLDELLKKDVAFAKKLLKNSISVYDFFIAAALKRHSPKDPVGKKKIVEELMPVFSKISNTVMLDHYITRLSEAVSTPSAILYKLVEKKVAPSEVFVVEEELQPATDKSVERLLLALLFKVDIDTMARILYKLGRNDFLGADPQLARLFMFLKQFAKEHKKFSIRKFIGKIDEDLKDLANDLYLWEAEGLVDTPEKLDKELDVLCARVRLNTIRKRMRDLSEELRLAELERDQKRVKSLTEKINKLSKKLS